MKFNKIGSIAIGATLINISIVNICNIEYDVFNLLNIIKVGTFLCNISMGILIVISLTPIYSKHPLYRPYWLGMIITNAIIVKNIDTDYLLFSSLVFISGLFVTILSIMNLGLSFAITPMFKKIKTTFLYQQIRHPMYFGEMLMLFACVISNINTLSIICFLLCIFFLLGRIKEEERILLNSADYKEYIKTTKWKLLPYIW